VLSPPYARTRVVRLLVWLLPLIGGLTTAFGQSTFLPVPDRRAMVFDHAGRYLYITRAASSVQRYDLSTGRLNFAYNIGGSLVGADIAADDSFLLIA
jgi:hypothetical protein